MTRLYLPLTLIAVPIVCIVLGRTVPEGEWSVKGKTGAVICKPCASRAVVLLWRASEGRWVG